MKAFTILSFAVAALATVVERTEKKGACNADNCARHVTGTGGHLLPSSVRKADCTKFQQTTVTPEPVTTTVTVTVDGDEPVKFRRHRRDVEARDDDDDDDEEAVPEWATQQCPNSSRYASACSCWGITATTDTAPTPTVTETVTETVDYCDDL